MGVEVSDALVRFKSKQDYYRSAEYKSNIIPDNGGQYEVARQNNVRPNCEIEYGCHAGRRASRYEEEDADWHGDQSDNHSVNHYRQGRPRPLQ